MKILFVADPMCSWCWGFEPQLLQLRSRYHDNIEIIMGGLRNSLSWDEESRFYLKEQWQKVEKETKQPFNRIFFEQVHFQYNTFPSCKAVICVREIEPKKTFSYFHALQKAFYQEARDITQKVVLSEIAQKEGIDKERFIAMYDKQESEKLMQADFQKARMLGANSFPSIVLIDDEGHLTTLKGYRTFEELTRYLHR